VRLLDAGEELVLALGEIRGIGSKARHETSGS
jgi:hypothetical protein